jgi:hypothetical protein
LSTSIVTVVQMLPGDPLVFGNSDWKKEPVLLLPWPR